MSQIRKGDIETNDDDIRFRMFHYTAMKVHISIVKELIEEWNADINARDNGHYRGQKIKTNTPLLPTWGIIVGKR